MCEGSGGAGNSRAPTNATTAVQQPPPPRPPRRPPRRRRVPAAAVPIIAAVDHAPPVATLQAAANAGADTGATAAADGAAWRCARLTHRTPQHLGTLTVAAAAAAGNNPPHSSSSSAAAATTTTLPTISCPPVLVANRHLVAACHDGNICLWNLMHLPAMRLRQNNSDSASSAALSSAVDVDRDSDVGLRQRTHAAVAVTDAPVETDEERSSRRRSSGSSSSSRMIEDPVIALDTLATMAPLSVVDTATTPTPTTTSGVCSHGSSHIVQLAVAPAASALTADLSSSNRDSSVVVAAHAVGTIHVLTAGDDGTLHAVAAFHTARGGVTSAAVTLDSCIVVGYQTGHLEGWSVQRRKRMYAAPADGMAAAPKQAAARDDDWSARLRWRAVFSTDSPQPAIAAIAQLPVRRPSGNSNNSDTRSDDVVGCSGVPTAPTLEFPPPVPPHADKNDVDVEENHEYLVLTLHHDSSTRPGTASMVEVVDVASIATAWRQLPVDVSSTAAVSLDEHWILPEAGREILDSSTVASDRPSPFSEAPHWIPSLGTNSLCSIAGACCAAGLADGMVTVLDAGISADGGQLAWGVSMATDQLCLAFPCIGIGCVDIAVHDGDEAIPYVACCLRGSTTYVIPVYGSNETSPADSPLLTLSIPHDLDDDSSLRHLQGFAAMNLGGTREHSRNRTPILVYVWPGGVVDIYSCGLLQNAISSSDLQLRELLYNGSADLLRYLLLSSSEHESSDWNAARTEVQVLGENVPITIDDLRSQRFTVFRSVLMRDLP